MANICQMLKNDVKLPGIYFVFEKLLLLKVVEKMRDGFFLLELIVFCCVMTISVLTIGRLSSLVCDSFKFSICMEREVDDIRLNNLKMFEKLDSRGEIGIHFCFLKEAVAAWHDRWRGKSQLSYRSFNIKKYVN